MTRRSILGLLCAAASVVAAQTAVASTGSPTWSSVQKLDEIPGNSSELNTPAMDGCPIQSPDGRNLYMASTRPRFAGDTRSDLDIWVARRPHRDAPWGAPANLGEPVNSAADDFCPTPIGDGGLFFVSREALPGSCGMGDIYFTRWSHRRGWREPQHLACAPEGPNSALDEQGPSYVQTGWKASLYFSRSAAAVPGDIYVSTGLAGWGFGPAAPVVELNDADANDIQPNVRSDGREVVLSSNRAGTLGGQDVWVARRRSAHHPWSQPVNLGGPVNTGAAETRPSLSYGGWTLLFGRAPGPEGMSDIYQATRRFGGRDD